MNQKIPTPTFLEILKEEFDLSVRPEDITDEYLTELDLRFGMSEGYFKRLWHNVIPRLSKADCDEHVQEDPRLP